jgi:hypothetical protein
VNGVVRPQIKIAPGEQQFWRIVNASPDLYADLEIDISSLAVVALDGMPFAFHDPSTRSRMLSHVLLARSELKREEGLTISLLPAPPLLEPHLRFSSPPFGKTADFASLAAAHRLC